jgi:hypothetical protein
MNKRTRVAARKHRVRQKNLRDRRKAERQDVKRPPR